MMGEKKIALNETDGGTKSIRYPLIPINDNPHRYVILMDSLSQAFKITAALALVETILFVLLHLSSSPYIGAVMLGGLFLCIAVAAILRNAYVNVSASGLSFPLLLAPILGGRVNRGWDDVESVDVRFGQDYLNTVGGDVLSFRFKSGGHVDLELMRIRREDVEALRDGLTKYAPVGVCASAVSDLVSRLDLETTDSTRFVFAKAHRKLLNRQYSLTDKIPHDKGSVFFDGSTVVEKLLAAGGNRSLYLVADNRHGQNLRLQEYDLSFVESNERSACLNDLLAESIKYLKLEIPHLLNLVECKVIEERFFLLSEPESVSLRTFVQKRKMTEKAVLSMALNLAEAVAQTSAKGLLVGGIRPDSISYAHNGTTLIGEYGFADDIISRYTNSSLFDAPYAAPERLKGSPCPASDLYSIGAVMFFALSGSDPDCLSTSSARAINKKVSVNTDLLIQKLMSTDAGDRGTALDLVEALGGGSRHG